MSRQMILFTAVTLTAPVLIAAAALWGGWWAVAALAFLTAITASLDEFVSFASAPGGEDREFPEADRLSTALALAHFALLALMITTLTRDWLNPLEKLAAFAAAGLFFGQVSNSNAHELIHRSSRFLHGLGKWVYISVLFGHHTSAHPLVHHIHVATRADPSSARQGESLYRFMWRAWRGSFRQGAAVESARLKRAGKPRWHHPYMMYIGGGAIMLALAALIGGPWGIAALLALAGFAQTQLLMSDYVQHYGLTRAIGGNGKPVPVAARHSWNTPHWFSSALMLNAPRHSDHHAHPARPYPALELPADAPMLPRSLPVMACVALYPRLWRRVMDPRADEWATKP
ncbi:alkane 1-monooxygenase [Octadecabacter sp. SW4]|nr:alkane 1-monooxygenase [Octadecabacter sp. SW4]